MELFIQLCVKELKYEKDNIKNKQKRKEKIFLINRQWLDQYDYNKMKNLLNDFIFPDSKIY